MTKERILQAKDIAELSGYTIDSARKLLTAIKKELRAKKVTYWHYCEYFGIPI